MNDFEKKEKNSLGAVLGILLFVVCTGAAGVYFFQGGVPYRLFDWACNIVLTKSSVTKKGSDQTKHLEPKYSPTPRKGDPTQKPKVYAWVNDKGVRNFSNKKPTTVVRELKIANAYVTPNRRERAVNESATLISRSSSKQTRVVIVNNRVLVPVVLKNQSREVATTLVLDTGATSTTIHRDLANELSIWQTVPNTSTVADGRRVATERASIESIRIGPYFVKNFDVSIIDYEGDDQENKGLLGMNFLKHVKFNIDFKNQAINWH